MNDIKNNKKNKADFAITMCGLNDNNAEFD